MIGSDYIKYPDSMIEQAGTQFSLWRNPKNGSKKLVVEGNIQDFLGEIEDGSDYIICDLTHENASVLCDRLEWLKPVPLGLQKSFGFGDRLGMATPGHVNSLIESNIAPIFAQQSVRENTRTGRNPQTVVFDAMWGVFQAGWKKPWGADADHIKLPEVLPDFVKAGYTFFTVDPGDHVDQHADHYPLSQLETKLSEIPWDQLSLSQAELYQNWLGKELPELGLRFDKETLMKAVVKYGRAIAHTVKMYQSITKLLGNAIFDFEVSVDETDSPTSVEEHFFIASELRRLGVRWTSLAPRFIGRFEKGVDYIGNLNEFDQSMQRHAAVADLFGTYKISLHSGSDKFSVYPCVNQHTNGRLHIKTAGTSYLEALKVVAEVAPVFFGKVLSFAHNRYLEDKVSYHVSADLARVPKISADPAPLLDEFNARQVFHVTYGSVLDHFKSQIYDILQANENLYYEHLSTHFKKHLLTLNG